MLTSEISEVSFNKPEPINNLITWVYENRSFVPIGKLTENESFSIVSDYIGRPVLAFDEKGEKVWSCDYDIYGRVRKEKGISNFVPFRYQGQYYDEEINLCYNRFRYYDCNTGTYISQDPIGLLGGLNVYAYVRDTNGFVDIFGLDCNRVNKARKRQHKMLQDNQGFNVSPIDWDIYPTIGRNGTFITDKKAISDYFGNFTDGETITISLKKATEIEKGMGLNPESLKKWF